MPAADFAAAQQRIAARRAQRAANQQAHHNSLQSSRPVLHALFPFDVIGSAWSAIKGRSGTRPEFRVGQVDAELLDEGLLTIMKDQVGEGLKYFGTHISDHHGAEIMLGLRLILFKLSIWDQNASYGAHLQGLRYTDARSDAPNRPPPKNWQKLAYGFFTIGGKYAWTKWEEYLLTTPEDYTIPESPKIQLLSRLTELATSAHDIACLTSFLVFLVNGRYRTITDRLLRLRLTPASHSTSREVSFEYLNRQLVWHAFTEFLLFLLPLVGISRWRRILGRSWLKLRTTVHSLLRRGTCSDAQDEEITKVGELGFLPERTCAICYRDQNPTTASEADIMASSARGGGGGVIGSVATDITNPYEAMPCGCIHCFACLAQRIANEEGEGWTCLRCGEVVKECQPWSGDIVETRHDPHAQSHLYSHDDTTHDRPQTAKSVGFAPDQHGNATDHADEHGEDVAALREIEPMPEHDDDDGSMVNKHASSMANIHTSSTLHDSQGLDFNGSVFGESLEWARASKEEEDDEEEQREESEAETDEDEEVEATASEGSEDELGPEKGFAYHR